MRVIPAIRSAAADIRAYWDWNRNAIRVGGDDPSGHWSNLPRPDVD